MTRAAVGDSPVAAVRPKSRLRSALASSVAPLLANGFSAIANTAAVFALSTSAGDNFSAFAASSAALILAYGTARSLLGEPLMLAQRDRQTGSQATFPTTQGWVSASLAVGITLGVVASAGLWLAGIEGMGWITFAAVAAFVFNDAARHLCFARGSAWTAAIADVALALFTLVIWAIATRFDPYQVYWLWLGGAALAGVLMTIVTVGQLRATGQDSDQHTDAPAEVGARLWMRSGWDRTRWLVAEAAAVTAAITLPLILVADEVAGPGRLLLSWFGFQQILFFAAYAISTRSGMKATRTAGLLFCAGAVGAVAVAAIVALTPEDVLVKLFGPSASQAQRWALWFGVLQLITAAGNAVALSSRLISGKQVKTATRLFRCRLFFAAVSTIGAVIGALTVGLGGYIAGSVLGAFLHVIASVRILQWPALSLQQGEKLADVSNHG